MQDQPVPTTEQVIAQIDAAVAALTELRATAYVLQDHLEGKETNMFNRSQMAAAIQNLQAARGDVSRGILRDHMGYQVGSFADIAHLLGRDNDLAGIIEAI